MASKLNGYSHQSTVSTAPDLSIALLLVLFAAFLLASLLSASAWSQSSRPDTGEFARELPPLGNTTETDRLMLREIADTHIFDASSRTPKDRQTCCHADSASGSNAAEASTVWQFVQQSQRLPIPDNDTVANYRQQYQREALWVSKILQRATPFAGHIVESLDARFMPLELALLPAIESGYQASVHSAKNAAGLWQIVPATAKEMGVSHTSWYDGRSDLLESTNAAIAYLSYLNAEFHGDWLLTLAAYNAGPGRVRAAIRRNRSRGLSQDFWSLRLPRETREYVPKFLALVALLRHDSPPELNIPRVRRGNAFEVLEFAHRISLDKIATLSGISDTTLKQLNAALVHGVTPPTGPHRLYILKTHLERVTAAVTERQPDELYTQPTTHSVVAGDSISTIADKYGLSQPDLMAINDLDSSLIKVGQKLAVRFPGEHWNNSIEYVITIGDTLSDIALQFSVDLDQIRDERGKHLEHDVIHPGEKLIIVSKAGRTS